MKTTCSLTYRVGAFILFMLVYSVLYVIPNFFLSTPPYELPLLWIDQMTPLIPWTFLIYTSDYLVFVFALILLEQKAHFLSFARMMFGILLICGIFFYTFPTTYPRPLYPEVSNPVIRAVMEFVAAADTPRNCFPSMHVGLTAGATWALRHFGIRIWGPFSLWSLLIFVSTLTTKQHYFLDILGGLGVMAVVATLESLILLKAFNRLSNSGHYDSAQR